MLFLRTYIFDVVDVVVHPFQQKVLKSSEVCSWFRTSRSTRTVRARTSFWIMRIEASLCIASLCVASPGAATYSKNGNRPFVFGFWDQSSNHTNGAGNSNIRVSTCITSFFFFFLFSSIILSVYLWGRQMPHHSKPTHEHITASTMTIHYFN